MSLAVLFPGQGSQFVGMSQDVFEARPDLLVDRAEPILGWSLRELCAHGPTERLTDTRYAQPVLYAVAYAMWEETRSALPAPAFLAGHSLGEYTALAASGMVSFEDGLRLVAARGSAMAEAAAAAPSAMAAILGADEQAAQEIVAQCRAAGGTLSLANINAPTELVVAGSVEDIEWTKANGKEFGARRVIPLQVAGAFHTEFMASAVQPLRQALADVGFSDPRVPVIGNTDARPLAADTVAETLSRQVTEPVRFAESLRFMAHNGVDTFIHVGPGHVTAGMAKRTVDGATVIAVSELADVATARSELADLR